MLGMVYGMVACGVSEATGSFWKGVLWPYHAGMVIGHAVNSYKNTLKS